ncbi:Bud-site selection protein [Lophiotrema nucula]|uniref:Bud-site selection protein n=1 Tax=Lophiotrema nucula TaxID=690887 RepID=A0A6A5ZGA2_9PLEO|nr:Bud-site selection protein [Lophiotrema nucula]
MPKRKRPSPSLSPSDDDVASSRALARQRKLCTHRLDTAKKALVSQLRLGAGFERQKYSRRKKTAKTNNDEKAIARLDAEYKVLKELDFTKVAEGHLRKTVLKVKSLQASEALPDAWREAGEKEKQTSEALNVTARLFKVKGVREVVDECIEDLKGILGIGGTATTTAERKDGKEEGKEEGKGGRKKARMDVSEDKEEDWSDADEEHFLKVFGARIAAPSSGEESDASLAEDERPPSVVDSQGEEEWEGFEDESEATRPEDYNITSASDSDAAASSEAIGASDLDESEESEDDTLSAPKAKPKTKGIEKITTSTIIPSLSMGGYYSGTESEASDLDDIAPKKNRRGQRARQKIWEQKYGEKAEHIKKQERNTGWDAKRGAVDNSRDGKGRDRKPTGRGPQTSGENATPLGQRKPKRDDAGALHPSWAAAKAAKEKKVDVKPMGKKITFD